MAKRLGSDPGRNLKPPSIRNPIKPKAKGIYPDATTGAGQYGSV